MGEDYNWRDMYANFKKEDHVGEIPEVSAIKKVNGMSTEISLVSFPILWFLSPSVNGPLVYHQVCQQ